MDFYAQESQDSVRFSWNILPPNRSSLLKLSVPLGCLYSPMNELEALNLVEYKPLSCQKCSAILNPTCKVDFKGKWWLCPFCGNRNGFPKEYADNLSEINLPAELVREYSTLEYIVSTQAEKIMPKSIFMFLVDTCMPAEELNCVKDSILQAIHLMPHDTPISLVTFGKNIFIHELSHTHCPKSYSFKGDKELSASQIYELLGMATKNDPRGPLATGALSRFVVPLNDCEQVLIKVIEGLKPDAWPVGKDERPYRCTGNAYNIAIGLLEASYPRQGCRIISFLSGPCTYGPGIVVGLKLVEPIRCWVDIQKKNEIAKYTKNASKFYQGLANRAVKANITIDILAYSADQFGLFEMKYLSESTGGISTTNEQFNSQVFKDTVKKFFEKDSHGDLRFGFSGDLTIHLTKELRISGALGPCTSTRKPSPLVSTMEIGQGGTVQWYLGGMDKNTTIAFYFDLPEDSGVSLSQFGILQFVTRYRHPNGSFRMRVTTIHRDFGDPSSVSDLGMGFDQEAACALVARMAIAKSENESSLEIVKWIDRTLVKLASRFADYRKDEIGSFVLPKEFSFFPGFMYHLRKSNFLQTFSSPDENTYYRGMLLRENTNNITLMIQPSLIKYEITDPEPKAVILDVDSMKDDVILLMDTFFDIVIWEGKTIVKWEKEGYQEKEEYQNFKKLLQMPLDDAKVIMDERFPAACFSQTWPGHTKERKVKSKVNPSSLSLPNSLVESGDFITDDASMKLFVSHLVRLVVNSSMK